MAMPKFYQVWKILSAVEKSPEYRIYTEKIQQMTPQDWIKLHPDTIRTELHKIHSNKTSLQHKDNNNNEGGVALAARRPPPPPSRASSVVREGRGVTHTPNTTRSDTPRKYPVSDQLKHFNCPEGVCLGHFRFGRCPTTQKGKPYSFFTHTQWLEIKTKTAGQSWKGLGEA